MMFLFLIEYISSVLFSMSISMGAWVVYKTAGGVYYGARWLTGGIPKQITEHELAELHKEPVVVITEEEYLNLLSNKQQLKHIEDKLEKLEERIH
jgi:hypothetical protein